MLVRYSLKGQVKTSFVGIKNIPVGDAEAILSLLNTYLHLDEDTVAKKIVGLGCDGASVNTGKKGGVAEKLRTQLNPTIIDIHCMAHRLELAYKDALKNVALYRKLDDLLTLLYGFYHKSPKQRSGLREVFKETGAPSTIPPRTGGTRWMAHFLSAVNALLKGYKSFLLHLQRVSQNLEIIFFHYFMIYLIILGPG